MKLSIVSLFVFLSLGAFASSTEKLELGLYLPDNGGSCAYQVVDQKEDSVVIIFRRNPLVTPKDPCAVGVDYVIKADVLDSKAFVDVRTNSKFYYHSKF